MRRPAPLAAVLAAALASLPAAARGQDTAPAAASAPAPATAPAGDAGGDAFLADLNALCSTPHRLAGTPEGNAAADYIHRRLEAIGMDDLFRLEALVCQTHVARCELRVAGKTIPLLPVRPNLTVPPATGPEGLTGPLLYAGSGRVEEFGNRDPNGAIVVLDYDCQDRWQRAFAMGAKAVIFLGGDESGTARKHIGMPMRLVRLYAPPSSQKLLDLRANRPAATVVSHVTWRRGKAANVLGFLAGTDPVIDPDKKRPEVVVLSTGFDSFGFVPRATPAARRAANVAALLETAAWLKANRPRRHVLLAFLDNQAQNRHGARLLYKALMLDEGTIERLHTDHRRELAFVDGSLEVLADDRQWAHRTVARQPDLRATVREQANFRRADVSQLLSRRRLAEAPEKELQALEDRMYAWDWIRRRLVKSHLDELPEDLASLPTSPEVVDSVRPILPELLGELPRRTADLFRKRQDELRVEVAADATVASLRRRLLDRWIALHVSYNLSGGGGRWGIVPSDSTRHWMNASHQNTDHPGDYIAILRAFRQAAEARPLEHFDRETVADPLNAVRFPAGRFASDGTIAGLYGVYNVAVMTGADARPRDGHPSDVPEAANVRAIRTYARQAARLIKAAADTGTLSAPRKAQPIAINHSMTWDDGAKRGKGNFVGRQVTGGLKEDRPAAGAVAAMWWKFDGIWNIPFKPAPSDMTMAMFPPVNQHGFIDFVSLPLVKKGQNQPHYVFATTHDGTGLVSAATVQEGFEQKSPGRFRVQLVDARGFPVFYPSMCRAHSSKHPLQVLGAVTNVQFPQARRHVGEYGDLGFFYLSLRDLRAGGPGVKVFSRRGPVLLGMDRPRGVGDGVDVDRLDTPAPVDAITAENAWNLNEQRLRIMRARGIANAAMERIHYKARDDLSLARTVEDVAVRQAALVTSEARSRRIYQPVRDALDDLVTAVVILLLLTILFAFAMERLLFCATTVYGRLAGFVGVFLLTFALLYLLHPGFAVATTPIIIFLAFVIILLSSTVIFILLRKFNVELRELQGQSTAAHAVVRSRMGTLIAAANLGMSTMRRRPLRTALTALTVLLLSFTILCFASVGSQPGVRSMYLGTTGSARDADVLIRKLDYSPLPVEVLEHVRGRLGDDAAIAAHWWRTQDVQEPPFSVTDPASGEMAHVKAIMGVEPRELEFWPELAATLEPQRGDGEGGPLRDRGVYLPPVIRDQLDIEPGQEVLVNGHPAVFAGVINANEIQRLRHIDNERALPVDFRDPSVEETRKEMQKLDEEEQADVHRTYARLSPSEIAVAPAGMVRAMFGQLHIVRLYVGPDADSVTIGHELAAVIPTPVWMRGPEGTERLVFTSLLDVRAGHALFVPLVLGGLIVFGTMLGSITDREKEIYTFSALGLSPGHVGLLFFAEASVYAVVGGMGGQLLAQVVAVVAGGMARAGWITAPSLNFSSTNSLFAIFVVMATVLISAIYPAMRASRSANPGLARSWRMPRPKGDELDMVFPFTVSAYDITGVVAYLAEHFRAHDDAGLGQFASTDVGIRRDAASGHLVLWADLALAPFDLGVTQHFELTAQPSEIEGVDEVAIHVRRRSGTRSDWARQNRVFIRSLRNQFLLWRTLSQEAVEAYRMQTLREIGAGQAAEAAAPPAAAPPAGDEPRPHPETTAPPKRPDDEEPDA